MSKDKQKKPSKIRGIVREAWQITAKNRVLHTFGVIAATLTLLVGLVYMLFRIEYFFPHLVPGLSFFSLENLFYYLTYYPSLTLAFLGLAAIVFLAYLTLPVWCEAALIATIARIREGQAKDYSFGRASSFGLQSFLPLFEFEALTVVFDITRSFTILLLIWRYFGPTLLWQSTPLIIFILLVIFLISIALIYSRYNIVLHHGEVFKSIIKSLTLVTRGDDDSFGLGAAHWYSYHHQFCAGICCSGGFCGAAELFGAEFSLVVESADCNWCRFSCFYLCRPHCRCAANFCHGRLDDCFLGAFQPQGSSLAGGEITCYGFSVPVPSSISLNDKASNNKANWQPGAVFLAAHGLWGASCSGVN